MGPDFRTYLLDGEGGRVFGPGPADLLERVDRLGSLRAAALEMGMAYTKATRIVRDAERALGSPLTERSVGGIGGGGSRLTPLARDLVERYRSFERAAARALGEAYAACFAAFDGAARLGCVVMASGEGRRFGGLPGGKLTAPLAGVPVLERALSAIPGDLFDVVVVTRWDGAEGLCARLGVRCVRPDGPLKSDTVRAGLRALGGRAGCLFVTGDQPLLRPSSVRAMARELIREPGAIVRLGFEGRAAGPVLWPADELRALFALRGDAGGAVLLRDRAELAARVRVVRASGPEELDDVDTRDDLARLEAALLAREECE